MNPHTKITSAKAATPPRSGDRYEHPILGPVKLVRRAGGESWHCKSLANDRPIAPNARLILRPSQMRPISDA